MFPDEMDVVQASVGAIRNDAGARGPEAAPAGCVTPGKDSKFVYPTGDTYIGPAFELPHYDAECSYSKDGRFILYAHVITEKLADRPDADIYVYDTVTREHHVLVQQPGYDGGPFFSPDGKMICYRSDRSLDDLLQLFVAELVFDERGVPVGTKNEKQLTANGQVNWGPFWHPSGKFLVYGNSGNDHSNYEVYAIEVDMNKPASKMRTRRITFADGADVLPVFNNDGSLMAWTCQRGPMVEGETKPSSQIWIAECVPGGFDRPETLFNQAGETMKGPANGSAGTRGHEEKK
jgi:roadblock/LC7 domain-containing protein